MKNLCIIPARSGSKGVPGKNIRPLNGKILIHYTFQSALESLLLDKVVLSTNCATIANSAAGTPVSVPYLRPQNLAADTTPTFEVVKHVIDFFDAHNEHYDNVVLLQPTCPFRSKGFVDRCIEAYVASGADSLVSVKRVPHEYNPHWVFVNDNRGHLRIATGEETIIPSRQLLPPAFARDGSVYVFKADNVRNYGSIYGSTISHLESDNLWHVNIDTLEDWQRAEAIASMQGQLN